MNRTAIVCTGELALEKARLGRALQRGEEAIVIAPPALAAGLGVEARWLPAGGDAECAAPCEQLLDSARVRLALEAEHRAAPLDEIRFAASTGAGWATCVDARQGGRLRGARLVLEVEADDAAALLASQHVRYREQLFREGRLAALRDATAIEGDARAIAALADAGLLLAVPEEPAAWSGEERPQITAVIAHKDHAKYLPACLAALRAQTLPLKIVLVDDGSSASALEVVAREEERDPGLRVIRQANAGPGAARNTGVAAAETELVLIVDADNLLRPHMAARLAEALRRRPGASAATCAMRRFQDDGSPATSLYCGAELSTSTLFVENTTGDACSLHWRRDLLEAGGFSSDRTTNEDWELWLRYAALGLRTCVVPEVLFDYRVGPDSRSVNMPELKGYSARLAQLHPALLAQHLEPAFTQLALERWHERLLLAERLDVILVHQRELQSFSRRAQALEARITALDTEVASLHRQLGEERARKAQADARIAEADARIAEADARAAAADARTGVADARARAEHARAEAALGEVAKERAVGAVLLERTREMQDRAARLEVEKSRRGS